MRLLYLFPLRLGVFPCLVLRHVSGYDSDLRRIKDTKKRNFAGLNNLTKFGLPSPKPTRLHNHEGKCALNAVLQCISGNEELTAIFGSDPAGGGLEGKIGCVSGEIKSGVSPLPGIIKELFNELKAKIIHMDQADQEEDASFLWMILSEHFKPKISLRKFTAGPCPQCHTEALGPEHGTHSVIIETVQHTCFGDGVENHSEGGEPDYLDCPVCKKKVHKMDGKIKRTAVLEIKGTIVVLTMNTTQVKTFAGKTLRVISCAHFDDQPRHWVTWIRNGASRGRCDDACVTQNATIDDANYGLLMAEVDDS